MSVLTNLDDTIWIDLPDGRQLSARLWLPKTGHSYPVIFEYLPYRKRDGTAERDATTHAHFVKHGYASIRVDIAGTGDSYGQFDDEYSEQELTDGEAVLDWISSQDWCDGSIGMIGISWGGFNDLQLAFRRPPSLKAIVTVASTTDRYADDIHYMGGCLLSDNSNWGATMLAFLSRPADPLLRPDWREDWISRMENMPDLTSKWLGHQTRDDYWKHGSVCEDWQRINVPVLAITGWADAYVNTPGYLVEHLSCQAKALIGPWEHRYPHISKLGAADFHAEVLNWFDCWLKGQKNNVAKLPQYRTFCKEFSTPTRQMTPPKGRWIAEADWPSPNITEQAFYLNGTPYVEWDIHKKDVIRLHRLGFQIHCHCNGDAGADMFIDAVENALKDWPRKDHRHTIMHGQTLRDDQLDQIARLGMSVSFFSAHIYYWGDLHYTTILGPARAERISPAASAQQRGIRFTIHNDASVTPTRPLHLAHCAVERQTYGGRILGKAQKISRLSALRAMTIDAAWQVFEDSKRGSIENGKLADLVILSDNPLKTSKSLSDIRVMQTIRRGTIAYQA